MYPHYLDTNNNLFHRQYQFDRPVSSIFFPKSGSFRAEPEIFPKLSPRTFSPSPVGPPISSPSPKIELSPVGIRAARPYADPWFERDLSKIIDWGYFNPWYQIWRDRSSKIRKSWKTLTLILVYVCYYTFESQRSTVNVLGKWKHIFMLPNSFRPLWKDLAQVRLMNVLEEFSNFCTNLHFNRTNIFDVWKYFDHV